MQQGSVSARLKDHLLRGWDGLGAIEGNLTAAAGPEGAKTILVISGAPGEGRTTAAACLGWALSASGRTLLIDAHVNKPDLCRTFTVPPEPGLSDVVLNGLDVKKAIRATEAENLSILPGGRRVANSAAVFRREGFAHLTRELRERWDYVICDCPPFLQESDASIMARHFDGAVQVLVSEKTRWEVARLVADRLQAARGRLLGAVLNRRRFYIPEPIYRAL